MDGVSALSLPIAAQPPAALTPRPPLTQSLNSASTPSPRKTSPRYLYPATAGPTLAVTVVGASFSKNGKYFLSLSACGSVHHTVASDRLTFNSSQTFHFPISDAADLALKISATRVQVLPTLSPRGIMANNLDEAVDDEPEAVVSDEQGGGKWEAEVGSTELSLATLLSMPQPASASSSSSSSATATATKKHHEVELYSSGSSRGPRGELIGVVLLQWAMEDRVAEAQEAAERANELFVQRKTATAALRQKQFANGRRKPQQS